MNTIDVNKVAEYWFKGAEYDLETARSLMISKRFPHALFFGHLAIEKLLKAFIVKNTKQHALYTHSLELLATKSELNISDQLKDKLSKITISIWKQDTRTWKAIFTQKQMSVSQLTILKKSLRCLNGFRRDINYY